MVAGRTVLDAMARTVAAYGEPSGVQRPGGVRTSTDGSVADVHLAADVRPARDVAAALVDAALEPGAPSRSWPPTGSSTWSPTCGACSPARVPMSIYNTLSPDQVAFIAGHAEPQAVFLETADHLERWRQALAEVGLDPPGRRHRPTPSSLDDDRFVRLGRRSWPRGATWRHATRSTPGRRAVTPGRRGHDPLHLRHHRRPEGRRAQPPQRAVYECESATADAAARRPATSRVSYLPYAHIAERVLSLYLPPHFGDVPRPPRRRPDPAARRPGRGAADPVLRRPAGVGEDPVRPVGLLAMEPDAAKKAAIEGAMAVGAEYVESLQVGGTTTPELQAALRRGERRRARLRSRRCSASTR